MNIVLLDETRKRNKLISDLLDQKGHAVTACIGSSTFLDAISGDDQIDMILLDVESWQKGKSIYNQFDIANRIEETPITFFNAPEHFSTLSDRTPNQDDKIINKQADIEMIVDAVE